MEKGEPAPATPHLINLDTLGPLTVYVQVCALQYVYHSTQLHLQGDLEKQRDGAVFLTLHSLGTSYTSWLHFAQHPCMEDIRKRSAG